jgi:hypothetical protein
MLFLVSGGHDEKINSIPSSPFRGIRPAISIAPQKDGFPLQSFHLTMNRILMQHEIIFFLGSMSYFRVKSPDF